MFEEMTALHHNDTWGKVALPFGKSLMVVGVYPHG